MRTTLVALSILMFCSLSPAAFIPLKLDDKARKADLIVIGKVVEVHRIIPRDHNKDSRGNKGAYMGPLCMATVEISEVWKLKPSTGNLFKDDKETSDVSKFIMVPCRYEFEESPSELTSGMSYVLFLEELSSSIYHPLDPSSTHVIHQDRVANFGMDHKPEADWIKESSAFADFKKQVEAALKAAPQDDKKE